MRRISLRYLLTLLLVFCFTDCSHRQYGGSRLDTSQRTTTSRNRQWWCYPLPSAKVISNYGGRDGRRHTGVDLKTTNKDKILAAFDGVVVFSGKSSGYGNLVRLRHENGLETYYSHNSKNLVKQGERVRAGQVIALTGQTGRASTPHLHFETRIQGKPVNPNTYFDHQRHVLRTDAFVKKNNGYFIRKK